MGKILSGILGIQVGTKDPNLFTASVVVINGSSDTNSKEVYKGNDVTFTITPNDGYTLEDASISCSNGTLANNLLTISNIQSDVTCTITLDEDGITLAQAMLRDNPTIKERTSFSSTNVANTTGTIYKTNKTEDESDVYYYSGNTTNNWVLFGGFYWRIIRTNEDGSVRMLYSGTSPDTTTGCIGPSQYGNETNSPQYVGYMHGENSSLGANRRNVIDSTIKKTIDTWYENNLLTNYDKYISKSAIYCNDRSISDGTYNLGSDAFYYGAYTRLIKNKTPSYKCGANTSNGLFESTQSIADKFSASTDGGGNGKLTYPIALMTADEVSFAGGVYGEKLTTPFAWYYTNSVGGSVTGSGSSSLSWWLLTPCNWEYVKSSNFCVSSSSSLYSAGTISGGSPVARPVISISKCAKVKSGIGTPDSPYEIAENSCD